MGGCFSSESAVDIESKKRSQQIDRKLEEDSRRLRRECKILLLGACRRAQASRVANPPLQDPARAANRPS